MSPRETESQRFSYSLGGLWYRRDWVYLLSLLVPFVVYNLFLKATSVLSQPGEHGVFRILDLMQSDIFFNLGYALLWIGLFAVAPKGLLRRVVVVLFHAVVILVLLVTTSAHQYFQETGTTLDYDIIALQLPKFDEIKPMLAHGVPLLAWVLLAAALLYAILGPFVVARAVQRRGGAQTSPAETDATSFLVPVGLLLLAFGFGFLSLLVGYSPTEAGTSFARAPFVNVVLTGAEEAVAKEGSSDNGPSVEHPAAGANLVPTVRTQKRNVVLIHLESTRPQSVTPYNKGLETTPFLDELSKESLLVERAYTTVPHTSKASVSVNCGISPHLVQRTAEAEPGGIPAPCLADLLNEQGYKTVLFQSSTKGFDDFGDLAENFGYEEYYSLESMDTEGFERSNYFGYEDDIMLKPSEEWLKERGDEPFMAEYLLGTGHHDYKPPTHYGLKDFSEDDKLDRYLNCLRYQDFFLRNLMDQYKELGRYEDTIFVIFGDHGEGFGEHGRYAHDDNPYEEALRVPLLIHAPGWFESGERVEGPSNHTDVLPTVLDLLGYEVKYGEYPGYSLLRAIPEDRTLMFSCLNEDKCQASIEGTKKYIHHYGDRPDEFFDLSEDPLEKRNLAGERSEEIKERRDELVAWRSHTNAMYRR